MRRTLAAAMLGAMLVAPCAAAQSALVQTSLGPVQGELSGDGSARMWLGLPYAEPPVGEHRWRAPQAHAPWTEVRRADALGSPCMQIGGPYGPPPAGKTWGASNIEVFGKPVGSEDCLTLNLWRPANDQRQLPVIVFVHGGSNVAGYSADPIYDGARLAATADALVVTLNYRLGVFGWFSHPSLEGGDALTNSGNYGTLDIIAALRFVQANAPAFGGDAGNVTLMGQSAGAINVYTLMASPLASGLFHKAIPLSGLIGDSAEKEKGYRFAGELAAQLVMQDRLATSADDAAKFIAAKGQPWLAQYLKGKSAAQLLDLLIQQPKLRKSAAGGSGDGTVVAADMKAAYEQGQFHHMPVLVGYTRDEAKLMAGVFKVGDTQRFGMMLNSNPDAPPTLKPQDLIGGIMLPSLGPWLYDTYTSTITSLLLYGVDRSVARLAKYEPRVFVYRFDWNRGPEPWKTVYGAAHAIDLPFVFGNFSRGFFAMDFSQANRPGREALSQLMMHAIGAFIRTGDPNIPEMRVKWRPWSGADGPREKLILDASDQAIDLSVR